MHVNSNCPDLGCYYGINEMQTCSDPVLFTYMICCMAQEIAGTPHKCCLKCVYIADNKHYEVAGFGVGFFFTIYLKLKKSFYLKSIYLTSSA